MLQTPPPDWGSDELTAFLDHARGNQYATFVNAPDYYRKLADVDGLFCFANEHLKNNEHRIPALFMLRAHSSFRGACRLAMSGQLPECYMVVRGALEFALYGFHFFKTPGEFQTWADRNDSEESLLKVKALFKVGRMFENVSAEDTKLEKQMRSLYERTIEYGAHPNSLALFTNLDIEETDDELNYRIIYLARMGTPMELAIKSVAQAGLLCLLIFEKVFTKRFELMGLPERIKIAQQGL